MHDGSVVRFRKVPEGYDPTDRDGVYAYLRAKADVAEVPTGLLYVDPEQEGMHDVLGTTARSLVDLSWDEVCPGAEKLAGVMERWR